MITREAERSLLAVATATNKKLNQDACAVVRHEAYALDGIVVADGVGSHYGAELASTTCVASIRETLESASDIEINLHCAFSRAREALAAAIAAQTNELPPELDWNNAFGTTLLCAFESLHSIRLAYVGNGAIFHIRGNFNIFPENHLVPWTALNYLNPHTLPKNGKNVLYKILSPRGSMPEATPTVLTLTKDEHLFGDIILVCSDGIYSYDQAAIGTDADGRVWISAEESIRLFFTHLKKFFEADIYTDAALTSALGGYLDDIRSKQLMTDDCSIGLLITPAALRYQASLKSHLIGEDRK
jgi:PPM family protein phosphatase